MPATLETEVDARVEFNGLVFGDLSAVKKFTNYFVERYGRASFQGHVAFSSQPLPGAAGYAIFEADRAQLAALERGFAQYAKNPSRVPGSNLTHHSLGPLSDVAGSRYRKSERLIGEGKLIGDPGSERRIYGPAFRGDSYPKGKVGYELRQFHKRHEELLSEMGSLSEQVQAPGGLERYKFYDAVELIHWDLPKTRAKELGVEVAPIWNYFVGDLGGQMRGTGPKFFGGTTSSERFYFPLRNWAKNPVIEALPAAERKAAKVRIEKATRKYIEAINAIAVKNKVSAEVVKNVQILNAQWADEVKLSQYFERFRATSQF
ncbi:MAG: hypothetical protein A2Z97_04855 [Bdellovibrionales bacterium GWB1_52_6]|nr:MAG: hypothetical protein A2Z97_04855 [Bdellovibrionales bacterium GWB1_52_6]